MTRRPGARAPPSLSREAGTRFRSQRTDTVIISRDDRIRTAAREYLYRRERLRQPMGTTDTAGRWWAAESEQRPCCTTHAPTRRSPYRMLDHCRTSAHVAALYEVGMKELLNAARYLRKEVVR